MRDFGLSLGIYKCKRAIHTARFSIKTKNEIREQNQERSAV